MCNLAPLPIRWYVLILFCPLFFPAAAQTRLPGSVLLRGQADVDSFAAVFAGQTLEIGGSLQLGGTQYGTGRDITDLRSLTFITQVGAFEVIQCDVLEMLTGLEELRVQGILFLTDNPQLRDISAISGAGVRDLIHIVNNPKLEAVLLDLSHNFSSIAIAECPKLDTLHINGPEVAVYNNVQLRNVGVRNLGRGDLPINRPTYLRLQNLPELRSIDFSDGIDGVPNVEFEDLPKLARVRSSKIFGSFVYYNGTDYQRGGNIIRFHNGSPRNSRPFNNALTTLDSFYIGNLTDSISYLDFSGFSAITSIDYDPSSSTPGSLRSSGVTLKRFNNLRSIGLHEQKRLYLTLIQLPDLHRLTGLETISSFLRLDIDRAPSIGYLGPWNSGLQSAHFNIMFTSALDSVAVLPQGLRSGWTDYFIGNERLRSMPLFPSHSYVGLRRIPYDIFDHNVTNTQMFILDNPELTSTWQGFLVDTLILLRIGTSDRANFGFDTLYTPPRQPLSIRGFRQLEAVLAAPSFNTTLPFYLGLHGTVDLEPFERLTSFTVFPPRRSGENTFTGQGPVISFSRDSRLVGATAALFPALQSTPYLTFRGGEPVNGNVLRTESNKFDYVATGSPIALEFPSLDTIHIEHRAEGLLSDTLYLPYTRPLKPGIAYSYDVGGLAPSQPTFYFVDNPEATRVGHHFDSTLFRDANARIVLIANLQLDDCSALCALVESGAVAADDIDVDISNGPDCQSLAEVLARCRAVGVPEVAEGSPVPSFAIFPNPARDRVELSAVEGTLDPLGYDLLNVQGQLLRALPIPSGVQRFGLDVSDLEAGVYVCRPRGGGVGRLLVIQ